MDVNQANGEIVIKTATKVALPEGISTDFRDNLTEVISEYDESLKGLKVR
ncbi:hypothetical protein ACFVVQ_25040 [Paenibacillus chitinolyticus]